MDHDLQFSWYNLHDQDYDHEHQTSFDFDSENMFLNPIHQLSPTNWADQAIEAADFICINPFLDTKDAATNTSPQCLLSGTNYSSTGNTNASGVSSGDSSQSSSGKRPMSEIRVSDKPKRCRTSSNINFQQPGNPMETDTEAIAQMKEMIYREAAFRPVSFAAETVVEKPKRKNVRISSDPQTVAARQRRERISERIRVLQKLVPGGNKMDTASMLDEAANYLKFLRSQVKALEHLGQNSTSVNAGGTSLMTSHASLVVPFTQNQFSMQTHIQFPHEDYPPPA